MDIAKIKKSDFQAYENIRESGLLNMFSPQVAELAGFSKDVHLCIIKNYTELCAKFPDVRDLTKKKN